MASSWSRFSKWIALDWGRFHSWQAASFNHWQPSCSQSQSAPCVLLAWLLLLPSLICLRYGGRVLWKFARCSFWSFRFCSLSVQKSSVAQSVGIYTIIPWARLVPTKCKAEANRDSFAPVMEQGPDWRLLCLACCFTYFLLASSLGSWICKLKFRLWPTAFWWMKQNQRRCQGCF